MWSRDESFISIIWICLFSVLIHAGSRKKRLLTARQMMLETGEWQMNGWMERRGEGGGWWHLLRHDQLHSNMLNSFLWVLCWANCVANHHELQHLEKCTKFLTLIWCFIDRDKDYSASTYWKKMTEEVTKNMFSWEKTSTSILPESPVFLQ